MSSIDVVCVLHGDPALPAWLGEPPAELQLHLVVNDPGPGRYRALPAAADVHVNAAPLGFAGNVNGALHRLGGWDRVVVTNFDVDADVAALRALLVEVEQGAALAAPALTDVRGAAVMSVGRRPGAAREFLRAAGLREGRLLAWQRILLRRLPGWTARNRPAESRRTLVEGEYLPWTLVALSRAAWDDVGPLDERFFLYAEDLDWGLRAHQRGWSMVLVADTSVRHHGRATQSPSANAHYEASHLRLHEKYRWSALQRWQRRGLAVRRWTPLRWLSPLDWAVVSAAVGRTEGRL